MNGWRLLGRVALLILFGFSLYYKDDLLSHVSFSWQPTIETIVDFIFFMLVSNLLLLFLNWLYRKTKNIPKGQNDNVLIGLENIYYIIVTVGIIITLLMLWGVDPITLFTSLSIVAAAIAIISKDYLAEIISGIIISFSKEVSIGDYIKIGDHKGKVIDLNLTKIALLNEDDDIIFLPNNKVFSSEVVNYTRKDLKKVNIEFEISIQSIKTVEELEQDLINTIAEYKQHIVPDSYNLRVVKIQKNSITMKFQYVFHRINRELELAIRKKTVRQVVNYVKRNNVPLPVDEESA